MTQTAELVDTQKQEAICPICHGTGYIRLDVPMGDPRFGKAIACQCMREEIHRRRMERLHRDSNLPPLTFQNFDPKLSQATLVRAPNCTREKCLGSLCPNKQCREANLKRRRQVTIKMLRIKTECESYAKDPDGALILTGAFGSGKTHLAAAIGNALVGTIPVFYRTVPDLLDFLRRGFDAEDFDLRFDNLRDVDLLILDDLGTQSATPWATEKVYQLINYRYQKHKALVVTTNCALSDRSCIEPRIASRLSLGTQAKNGWGKVLELPAADFRPFEEERG